VKAEDWKTLGKALMDNAELLEELASADDTGIPEPDRQNKTAAWLVSKGLIDSDNHMLHLSSLLLDIGAQVSIQGFERAAPDLKETLISIQQHCESYHAAKADNSPEDMERHLKRLSHTTRQVISHLRDEYLLARNFIEGGYGYSTRLSDRLRDIQNAMGRLRRLHDKLKLFSFRSLHRLTGRDRTLLRLLTSEIQGSLHSAVMRNRSELDELINRLDKLSLTVRKRSRLRQVVHAVDAFLLAGNPVDLDPLLEQADALACLPAQPLTISGSPYTHGSSDEGFEAIEQLMASLPQPKERGAPIENGKPRESVVVPVQEQTTEAMETPFARRHLGVMLRQLIDTRQSQSATAYWKAHGDTEVDLRIWLYALDNYIQLQEAMSKKLGKRLNYRLEAEFAPFPPTSANRLVLDLKLVRSQRAG